jgi:PAS domain S-box-containing protein
MQAESDEAAPKLQSGSRPRLLVGDSFTQVVEASPSALVLVGQSGQIEMVNRQTERMFGHDRSALLGEPLEILLPRRFRCRHAELQNGFLADMSTRAMGEGRDLFGLRKDGTEFPLEIGLNPIDIEGERKVLAAILDVTTQRKIDFEKEQQRQELARSNTELEEFAYAASHDLKAPLRAIAHLVQWIGEDITATASPETLENLRLLRGNYSPPSGRILLDAVTAESPTGEGEPRRPSLPFAR